MENKMEKPPQGKLILPKWLVKSPLEKPLSDYGMRILEDKIADIDRIESLKKNYPDDKVFNYPEQVLLPAFVDAHTHLYGVLAHGIPLTKAPSGFMPFLEEFWWPLIENKLDSDMVNSATDWNCAQMIRSGIASFYDCTEAPNTLPGVLLSQAGVVEKWGLRGILSFEATERVSDDNGKLGLMENLEMIKYGQFNKGLVQGLMCFHTTFTCSDDFIAQAYQLASEYDVLTHMHCSEGTYEPEMMLKRNGLRTLEHYDQLGLLGERTLASQCVQISPAEIRLLAERKARMTHMPLSNCEVGGGIAPLPELVEAGVTVGLGSDGYITDFFEVMRGAFLIHKASHCDPRVMPASMVWHLATAGGASALNLKNVGKLEPGWQADCMLIAPQLPTPVEAHNLYDQLLLYCNAADVDSLFVAGKLRKQNGVVLAADPDSLRERTREAARRLWN